MNLRQVAVTPDGVRCNGLALKLEPSVSASIADLETVTLGIRPESVEVADDDSGMPFTVTLVEELGADSYVYGTLPDDVVGDRAFVVRFDGRNAPRVGDRVPVRLRLAEEHVFHPETELRLG